MNKNSRESDYPTELESQFLLRLPEEPAKQLRNILKSDGDTLKNRFTIQVNNDMRHGEVKLDQWMMHAKIVDLPTIVESLKTFDNKSFYKTADICQMMICKEEPDQPDEDEEPQANNKKKDINKVDKKFLWPHGICPPTKNVRKRRFRKTLKKKCSEAPEIEKEVKKLLRDDNEAENVTWEIIEEDEVQPTTVESVKSASDRPDTQRKNDRKRKRETAKAATHESTSQAVDIFGGGLSDNDLEGNDNVENVRNVDVENTGISTYESHVSDAVSMQGLIDLASGEDSLPIEFSSIMFDDPPQGPSQPYEQYFETPSVPEAKSAEQSSEDEQNYSSRGSKENMTQRIEQARVELEELKARKVRTQHEITGLNNLSLQKRFQDILHMLNQDIMYKEMEYQGMITWQNSDEI